ncbi:MAG: DNRLRE domain-containing protein [Chloroflexi bacterium]|nr:DNRLRE domain-containing protein [Chloroflexota bacterium]
MKLIRVWLVLTMLLTPTWFAQADSALPPKPKPYPPLKLPPHLMIRSRAEGQEIVQLAPMQDTFVANGAGDIPNRNFGEEEVLYIGYYDSVLAEMRTLVGYSWQRPEKFLDLQAAALFFGVGGGAEDPMTVRVYSSGSPFQEKRATWNNSAWWGWGQPVEGVLGKPGYWYAIDVTKPVEEILTGSYYQNYLGFSLRSAELIYHFYKGTYSREFDPELAPQLVLQYRIDDIAPRVWFEGVGSWASTMNDRFFVRGEDAPEPSLPVYFELEYRLEQGSWQPMTIYSGGAVSFPNAPGKTIQMRLRGKDRFDNRSDWVYSPIVKLYSYDLTGRILDHRQRELPAVDPNISPEPWWVELYEEPPHFVARLKQVGGLVASPRMPGYGVWENEPLYRNHSPITITLPAADNMLPALEVENPDAWESSDMADSMHWVQAGYQGALQLTAAPQGRGPAMFCHKQFYDVADLNQPTIGFRFWYGTVYSIGEPFDLYWQEEGGGFHFLQRAMHKDGSTWDNRLWSYAWGDLTPFRTGRGRLCVVLRRLTLPGNPASLLLDRFSLGSTPSDLSLQAIYPNPLPQPGEAFSIDLVVRNQSAYTATGRIQITFDAEPAQKTPLPVLEPNATFTHTITATMPLTETLLFEATVGKPEIDRTPADNRVRRFFIPNPHRIHLPWLQ